MKESQNKRDEENVRGVQVVNDERTWERFYAITLSKRCLVSLQDDSSMGEDLPVLFRNLVDQEEESSPFVVMPRTGFLAPRGGASNACDECKPYSDTCNICIGLKTSIVAENRRNSLNDDEWWLLIGTEEEKWYYPIQISKSS
uniref:Uncharacterized protein n=1 Tax=Proboscia inermis TaxID=420281 RepID=A0A7S0BZJ6_9STRA|mmetsp:Transcript_18237/g.18478  ORF Transcript_18237/g.18478 Transcript_18237/m.18478 type:complete len:143 (+) Transcript_18237:2-430(+)